jgi:hypothetical protein
MQLPRVDPPDYGSAGVFRLKSACRERYPRADRESVADIYVGLERAHEIVSGRLCLGVNPRLTRQSSHLGTSHDELC